MCSFVQKFRQRSEDESSSTQHWMQVMHWVWAHFVIGGSIVFGFVWLHSSVPLWFHCVCTQCRQNRFLVWSSVSRCWEPSRKHKNEEQGATTWGVTLVLVLLVTLVTLVVLVVSKCWEPSRKRKNEEPGATTWGVALEKSKKCGPWLSPESMLFAFIKDNINANINAYKCFNTNAYTWIKCPHFKWERC